MVTEIFTQMGNSGSAFITFLKNLLESVMSIFWTAGSGDTAGSFTEVGVLLLVGMSVGIVYGVIRYITRLVKLRG